MTDHIPLVLVAGTRARLFPATAFQGRIELTIAKTEEELRAASRTANVMYSWNIPATVPDETPELRWIQVPSAGVDHLRDLPLWETDIVITASKGVHTVPMSEHLFAMLLALTRQIATLVRAQERHEWPHDTGRSELRLTELRGKTLAIVGWGKIGDGIAHLARAFGMRVIGTRWSVVVPREAPGRVGLAYEDAPWVEPVDSLPDIVYPAAQLHEVLASSDVVVLLLPLTQETRGSFGSEEFRSMRRGALFLSMGRGQVVDQNALVRALETGRLGGAGLDVFASEPLPHESPLWTLPNVIISPHVGGFSESARERALRLFAVNLTRYLEGQPLLNVVDRERGY